MPENYIPPSEDFHKNLMKQIKNSDDKCIIITGSPGVGKSTYISYLKKELENENILVIRHHYYLSNDNKQEKRHNYFDIKNSLFEQLNRILNLNLCDRDDLETILIEVSKLLIDKQLIIIIDGLDHLWRDIGKKDDLDKLFNTLLPIPDNIKLIIGTQPIAPKNRTIYPNQTTQKNTLAMTKKHFRSNCSKKYSYNKTVDLRI